MSTGKPARRQRLIEPVALRYIGAGAALLDVPARNLSAEEVAGLDVAQLLASGLYEPAEEPAERKEPDGTGT